MIVMAKSKETTQTVRITNETARLLNTLASWRDQSVAEMSEEVLNPYLKQILMKLAVELGKNHRGTDKPPDERK